MNRLGRAIASAIGLLVLAVILLGIVGGGGGTRAANGTARAAPAAFVALPAPASVRGAATVPSGGALVLPVAGIRPSQLVDSWGDAREGGLRAHEGLDIPAPRGTPVVACFAGRVEKLFASARGGTTLYLRSADGRTMGYYAHLAGYAPGVAEGVAVPAGATLGFVGDSGDAGPGNTHLHFALAGVAPGDRWWQGRPFNPFPLLHGGGR